MATQRHFTRECGREEVEEARTCFSFLLLTFFLNFLYVFLRWEELIFLFTFDIFLIFLPFKGGKNLVNTSSDEGSVDLMSSSNVENTPLVISCI